MTLSKTDRAKRLAAQRAQRYRERKAATAFAEQLRTATAAAIKTAQDEADRRRAEDAARAAEGQKRRCKTCGAPGASFSFNGTDYCSIHGAVAAGVSVGTQPAAAALQSLSGQPAAKKPPANVEHPVLPPIHRPDPLLFDRARDPYRPSWWNPRNGLGVEPIRAGIDPRRSWVSPPIDGTEQSAPPREGSTFSPADGHRGEGDAAREAAARAERFANMSGADYEHHVIVAELTGGLDD
jgi:hypothetical protein